MIHVPMMEGARSTTGHLPVQMIGHTIHQDGNLNFTGSWTTDIPINVSISVLEPGNYSFVFEASDGWGEVVSDEVLVVYQTSNSNWLGTLYKSLIGIGIATGVVLLTVLIVYIIKQKR